VPKLTGKQNYPVWRQNLEQYATTEQMLSALTVPIDASMWKTLTDLVESWTMDERKDLYEFFAPSTPSGASAAFRPNPPVFPVVVPLVPSIAKLLKANRHYKCKTLISSQYWNDIELQGRKQIDYVLLYRGLLRQESKLEDIYKNLDMAVPYETFVELYKHATSKKYNFLYVNVVDSEFRMNFTHSFDIAEEERDL